MNSQLSIMLTDHYSNTIDIVESHGDTETKDHLKIALISLSESLEKVKDAKDEATIGSLERQIMGGISAVRMCDSTARNNAADADLDALKDDAAHFSEIAKKSIQLFASVTNASLGAIACVNPLLSQVYAMKEGAEAVANFVKLLESKK